ncbi:MAG TPA: sigma-70 family RNA polymerase sigma factor [Acidobacteriota bacterium]|nr:sigma-70 family RNA polymerase sigma factor [Acidobacteriota bacterium]HRR57048.1 sigma-70 family RNA polymerase sigma factor [Acidobacteriota bacterium]
MGTVANWAVDMSVSPGGEATLADNALVERYLAGSETAFETLVYRYQDRLVNYLNQIIQDYDRAVDLCQETFVRVYRNADRYEGKYQFSTWLYRIATNLAIDELRRRERKGRCFLHNVLGWVHPDRPTLVLPDTRQDPEQAFRQKERLHRLEQALGALDGKYRLPFLLKEVEGLSYEETADVLGISSGTVKSRIHRAKLMLRTRLKDQL